MPQQFRPNDIKNEHESSQEVPFKSQQFQRSGNQNAQVPQVLSTDEHELNKFVKTKDQIYSALTIKGQLFLMPKKLCTYQFLKDVLSKKKLVFHSSEIVKPVIPAYAHLTSQKLIEVIKRSPETLKYVPDQDELCPKRVSKEWLVTIINTIDPSYFNEYITKVEARLKAKTVNDKIEIDPQMMEVLKSFVSVGRGKNVRSSVKNLKINSKKRKRPSVERKTESFDRAIRPTFDAKRQKN